MYDPVADVLAQRSALDRRAVPGVAVSILLHAGLTALAVYFAMHAPPPQPISRLSIRLAAPKVRVAAGASPAALKPKPVPKPVEKTPRIEAPKPEPLKPSTKPAEKGTVPFSPFGRSTTKGSENPVAPLPKPVEAAPAVPIGGTGVTELEGGDFPYSLYIERMTTLIGSRWFRPQTATGAQSVVYFVIDRDGRIRDAVNRVSSGNPTFDRAALRAVLEASPLPPLPFAYNGTWLGVHLTFR